MHSSLLFLGVGLVPLALAAYSVQDDYSGDNFLNMFTFDTEDDPTHGYVNYVDKATAQTEGLISVSNGKVTMKADSTKTASGRGRDSVRVTSTEQYTHGLVVLDLEHMPANACGIWPAFWMTGPSWPSNGEIDIIEGVNYQSQNAMTMHSNTGCKMVQKDCFGEQGCGVQTGGSSSYGDGFNDANGGVFAMEWTSDAINIWFFSRSSVPNGITGDSPDPSGWGNPTASFVGGSGCTIDDHFNKNNIVFDTTFCGDWAGQVWSQDSTCSSKAATCQDYVQNNPSAFSQAYWTINSLKVYSNTGKTAPSSSAAPPQTSVTPSPTADPVSISTPFDSLTLAPPPKSSSSSTTEPTPAPTTTQAVNSPSTSAPAPQATQPAANSGGESLGSSTPDGPLTENPIPENHRLGSTTPDGPVTENRLKVRSLDRNVTDGRAHVELETRDVEKRETMVGSMVLASETPQGKLEEIPVEKLGKKGVGKRAGHLRFHRHMHLGSGRRF